MNKFIGLFIIGLLMVGGVILFNQNKPPLKKEEVSKQAATTTSSSLVKEFTMTAKQWAFDPAIITVKQGDKVKINIKSIDVTHGFAI
ncbi:MAG: hypothetical protein WCT22_04760, partial [Patescibacteria group bacterium]